jgi:Ca2+-binding RTX toxin-like protein
MAKIRNSMSAGRRDTRAAARFALATVASVLSVVLLLGGASLGSASAAFLQPSPSGSSPGGGGGDEPSVAFLNPSVLYADHVPEISDTSDTIDTDYHFVAWTGGLVEDPIVEVSVLPLFEDVPVGNEITVGTLDPVPGTTDTWELFWDIPSFVPDGDAIATVRLFEQTILGPEEVASDEVEVEIDSGGETAELTWPTQNGPIGFYKPRGGSFRTYLDFQTSHATSFSGVRTDLFVTSSDPGSVPAWAPRCARSGFGGTGVTCTLSGRMLGSEVTAVAAEPFDCGEELLNCTLGDFEASDVHRVQPYLVDPHEMTIDIEFRITTDSPLIGRQLAGERASAGNEKCLAVQAVVRDVMDRPVLGANVDYHITGPTDQVQFGHEERFNEGRGIATATTLSGASKNPDKGEHSSEAGRNCDPLADEPEEPRTHGEQSDHNIPVRDDIKHRESVAGSALDGGTGIPRGGWWTDIYSPNLGLTQVTAWIDNEPVLDDSVNPEADDDVMEPGEPTDALTGQWLPAAATVSVDPAGGSAVAGTCHEYTIKLRAGTTPVRNLNVDVHATGPTDDLDFCDPSDGSVRQAPNTPASAHQAEDEKEAAHTGSSPRAQHTEGEADAAGNFVIGIMSPVPGDTTLTAWIDGTQGNNDDVQGAAPAENAVTFTHSWATSAADAEVSLISPSGFGGDAGAGGEEISNKDDGSPGYHIVTRVDAPEAVAGVEILLGQNNVFSNLGQATRIGNTDTYELNWAVDVADGDYTMRARIVGTDIVEDRTVRVNNQTASAPPDQPENQQAETASITTPTAGSGAAFSNRQIAVRGRASAGAEGIDLFYTKAPAKDTPTTSAWIGCGYADLGGGGTTVQDFNGTCALQSTDQPSQVTGLAAITFDCTQAGGNATPPAANTDPPRCPGARDSGDAHRVVGFEASPIVSIEPAETAVQTGVCQKMVLQVSDQTGQPIGNSNVDVHARGPEDVVDFCDPDDGTAHQRGAPNDGGHEVVAGQEDQGYHDEASGATTSHTEGTNTSGGRFVFGIRSDVAGDTQLVGWLDRTENDAQDGDEASDPAVVHWETEQQTGTCDIQGTDGSETLTGTSDSERICGFGGNDDIRGGGGNDVIVGGAGNDSLRGNGGDDVVRGNAGRDGVFGGGGNDRVLGGAGNDVLRGHRGNDRLRAHGGDDALDGGTGHDSCSGGKGRDRTRSCEVTGPGAARGFARRTDPF